MAQRIAVCVASMIVLVVCSSISTHALNPRVSVRLYDRYRMRPQTLTTGVREAERILQGAGIDVVWNDCSGRSTTCAKPIRPGELVVRIVRASNGWPGESLGYSYIDTGSGAGTLATVLADRVEATAQRLDLSGGVLLGRVIAHEIGHLLLGTADHSTHGLMRQLWPDESLMTNQRADWTFSGGDAQKLQARLTGDPLFLVARPIPGEADFAR